MACGARDTAWERLTLQEQARWKLKCQELEEAYKQELAGWRLANLELARQEDEMVERRLASLHIEKRS